jgi:c(7)-type cytochrome triheme protein
MFYEKYNILIGMGVFLMKKTIISVLVLMLVAAAGMAFAVPAGKTIEYEGNGAGKVTFSGNIHSEAGLFCAACHNPDMFPKMKTGAVKVTMKDLNEKRLCGVCHIEGGKAFPSKGNCKRCHKS